MAGFAAYCTYEIEPRNKFRHNEMITIKGTICEGYKVASGAIAKQKKHLVSYVPEIESMFSGTINVRLENPLSIIKYDVVTKPIKWDENRPHFEETFAILRASFSLDSQTFKNAVPCLLYFASTSSYRGNPFMVEIVAQEIPIKGISRCFLTFNEPSNLTQWAVIGRTAWSPSI